MPKSNDIVVRVFLPSCGDYQKYYSTFIAIKHQFAADLMPQDIDDPFALYGDSFALRNKDLNIKGNMWAANDCGYMLPLPSSDERGLIAGIKLAYNKNSSYVKSAKVIPFKNFVHHNKGKCVFVDGGGWRQAEADVDVITIGGRPFMWANAQDCKLGKTNIMDCFSIEYLGTAPVFEDADYGKNLSILQQIEDRVLKTFNNTEKSAIIRVVLSSKDNYDKATPYMEYYLGN